MNENYSLSYNMTWVFPVDSGFYYLLRLHFCEFFLEIRQAGYRVFSIFINNQVVVIDADVITWANGPQKAVSKDYATPIVNHELPVIVNSICQHFSFGEMKRATGNFDESLVIGVGGFGSVYKGCININSGLTEVAIKRLNPSSSQGFDEFQTEIEMLSKLRHLHLVSLIGYCHQKGEMILVYDYMSRGTLRDHLYNTKNPHIPWKQRLQICVGVARGIHYLHTGSEHTIIHRDIKSTNILLDENWVAKVSDFGLSKIGPIRGSKYHISTMVKGSFGYLDPEYFLNQRLADKSDVYSFGVVLLEMLCACPAITQDRSGEHISLAEWARLCNKDGTLDQIIDPNLKGEITSNCLTGYVKIAFKCLKRKGAYRPSMPDVAWSLEFALQLQENDEKSFSLKMTKEKHKASSSVSIDDQQISEPDTSYSVFSK